MFTLTWPTRAIWRSGRLGPSADDMTRLTKSQTLQPVGFGRLLGPLLKCGIAQRVNAEAEKVT